MPFPGREKGRRTGLPRRQGKMFRRSQIRRLPLGQILRPRSTVRSSGKGGHLRLVLPKAERRAKVPRRPDLPSKGAGHLRRKSPWKAAPAETAPPLALAKRRQPPAGTICPGRLRFPAPGRLCPSLAKTARHSGLSRLARGKLCPPPAGTANRRNLYRLPPIPGKAPAGTVPRKPSFHLDRRLCAKAPAGKALHPNPCQRKNRPGPPPAGKPTQRKRQPRTAPAVPL